jgi:hypothetical protein
MAEFDERTVSGWGALDFIPRRYFNFFMLVSWFPIYYTPVVLPL